MNINIFWFAEAESRNPELFGLFLIRPKWWLAYSGWLILTLASPAPNRDPPTPRGGQMVEGMFEAHFRIQYGALPFQIRDGRVEVLLVTTRETGRWIIPKGWPKRDVKPHKLAAREAYEEAGLVGKVSKRSCGQFRYTKRLGTGEAVACAVEVFPLKVRRELDDWPEKGQRRRTWIAPVEAARLVEDRELAALLGRVRLVV